MTKKPIRYRLDTGGTSVSDRIYGAFWMGVVIGGLSGIGTTLITLWIVGC